ncbi:hypothetical protein C9439_06155 [archaeon SCG-AAA382B04]|nr:hypothetical protein C9439_06155 [archaeon SCG-AAA382B04]
MKILDLLGNKNRLKILKELSKEPKYVTELSEILKIGRKAIIDHLDLLNEYGLIEECKKQGKRKYYRISNNFVLKIILSKNNSIIYFEDLKTDTNDKKEIINEFTKIQELNQRLKQKNNLKDIFSLLREIETELEKLNMAERFLGEKLDLLIEKSQRKINQKTENALEKQILLEILRNGQISPEELSKKLKVNRNQIFETISNLRKKELI